MQVTCSKVTAAFINKSVINDSDTVLNDRQVITEDTNDTFTNAYSKLNHPHYILVAERASWLMPLQTNPRCTMYKRLC
ncbi:hypothetical protein T12_4184 [Trichinella patagoniensis]|uniref:Uncharacterized protein n=1 Tax=Trichinella patagoniensis TaxID=990121 RepID=A0A0V0YUD9_9BILA|nr:hypothetical protein T12_4184 [Trichinella patagoniensis]